MASPTESEIQQKLEKLSSTVKMNVAILDPNRQKSDIVKLIEDEMSKLKEHLAKNSTGKLPSFNSKQNKALAEKIEKYQKLLNAVLYVESELGNVKTVLESHKLSDTEEARLKVNFDKTVTSGAQKIQDAAAKIENPNIKELAGKYKSALDSVNKVESKGKDKIKK